MNHTKAMLTDILLHLRKRAERGSGLAGAGSTGGSDVLPGPAALRRDRSFLQEVGDLSDACCALAEYAGEYQFSWASKWAWS